MAHITSQAQHRTFPVDSILLDGSRSTDNCESITSWLWQLTLKPGPSVPDPVITGANSPRAVVKQLQTGHYRFALKVTDADGEFSLDSIDLFIDPPIVVATLPHSTHWTNLPSPDFLLRGDGKGNAYILGIDPNNIFVGDELGHDLGKYDPLSKSFSPRASLPGIADGGLVVFASGGKGYVGGGYYFNPDASGQGNRAVPDFYRYDPLADAWSKLPDSPVIQAPPIDTFLPTGLRTDLHVVGRFTLNGSVYMLADSSNTAYYSGAPIQLWKYDASGKKWAHYDNYPGWGYKYFGIYSTPAGVYAGFGSDSGDVWETDWWIFNDQ
jgi:hypothetical protein